MIKNNRAISKKKKIFITSVIVLSMTGVEIIQLGTMSITPFYFLIPLMLLLLMRKIIKKSTKTQYTLFLWGILLCVFSMMYNNADYLSIIHFLFYIVAAITMLSMNVVNRDLLMKACKIVILLNFVNVVVAYLIYAIGIDSKLLSRIFITYFDRGSMRFCGFTTEPSYLAMILSISVMTIIKLSSKDTIKNQKMYYFLYVITIILSKTTFGLISLIFVFILSVSCLTEGKKRNNKIVFLSFLAVLGIIVIWILSQYALESDYINRIVRIIELLISSKSLMNFAYELRFIDGSAWYRVGPFVSAISELSILDFKTWIGHGIGSNVDYYTRLVNENTIIRGGFLQSGIYDYGIIGLMLIIMWIIKRINKLGIIIPVYFLLCSTNCAFSTQAFWYILLLSIWTNSMLVSYEGGNENEPESKNGVA